MDYLNSSSLDIPALQEALTIRASEARANKDDLLLALIASCDAALRRGAIIAANHLCTLIVTYSRGNEKTWEQVIHKMYSVSDSIIGEYALSVDEEITRRKEIEKLKGELIYK